MSEHVAEAGPKEARPVLEKLRAGGRGEAPLAPIAELIPFQLTAISEERATIETEVGPQHANPLGTLHGGILCDIADAAMGLAYASMLLEGESFTTIELKINFLKPIWTGRLR